MTLDDDVMATHAKVADLTAERDALKRQRKILTDIGFICGSHWAGLSEATREALSEKLDGSRGLVAQIIEWAVEFDVYWEALPVHERRDNYISEVDDFAEAKFKTLVVETRLEN